MPQNTTRHQFYKAEMLGEILSQQDEYLKRRREHHYWELDGSSEFEMLSEKEKVEVIDRLAQRDWSAFVSLAQEDPQVYNNPFADQNAIDARVSAFEIKGGAGAETASGQPTQPSAMDPKKILDNSTMSIGDSSGVGQASPMPISGAESVGWRNPFSNLMGGMFGDDLEAPLGGRVKGQGYALRMPHTATGAAVPDDNPIWAFTSNLLWRGFNSFTLGTLGWGLKGIEKSTGLNVYPDQMDRPQSGAGQVGGAIGGILGIAAPEVLTLGLAPHLEAKMVQLGVKATAKGLGATGSSLRWLGQSNILSRGLGAKVFEVGGKGGRVLQRGAVKGLSKMAKPGGKLAKTLGKTGGVKGFQKIAKEGAEETAEFVAKKGLKVTGNTKSFLRSVYERAAGHKSSLLKKNAKWLRDDDVAKTVMGEIKGSVDDVARGFLKDTNLTQAGVDEIAAHISKRVMSTTSLDGLVDLSIAAGKGTISRYAAGVADHALTSALSMGLHSMASTAVELYGTHADKYKGAPPGTRLNLLAEATKGGVMHGVGFALFGAIPNIKRNGRPDSKLFRTLKRLVLPKKATGKQPLPDIVFNGKLHDQGLDAIPKTKAFKKGIGWNFGALGDKIKKSTGVTQRRAVNRLKGVAKSIDKGLRTVGKGGKFNLDYNRPLRDPKQVDELIEELTRARNYIRWGTAWNVTKIGAKNLASASLRMSIGATALHFNEMRDLITDREVNEENLEGMLTGMMITAMFLRKPNIPAITKRKEGSFRETPENMTNAQKASYYKAMAHIGGHMFPEVYANPKTSKFLFERAHDVIKSNRTTMKEWFDNTYKTAAKEKPDKTLVPDPDAKEKEVVSISSEDVVKIAAPSSDPKIIIDESGIKYFANKVGITDHESVKYAGSSGTSLFFEDAAGNRYRMSAEATGGTGKIYKMEAGTMTRSQEKASILNENSMGPREEVIKILHHMNKSLNEPYDSSKIIASDDKLFKFADQVAREQGVSISNISYEKFKETHSAAVYNETIEATDYMVEMVEGFQRRLGGDVEGKSKARFIKLNPGVEKQVDQADLDMIDRYNETLYLLKRTNQIKVDEKVDVVDTAELRGGVEEYKGVKLAEGELRGLAVQVDLKAAQRYIKALRPSFEDAKLKISRMFPDVNGESPLGAVSFTRAMEDRIVLDNRDVYADRMLTDPKRFGMKVELPTKKAASLRDVVSMIDRTGMAFEVGSGKEKMKLIKELPEFEVAQSENPEFIKMLDTDFRVHGQTAKDKYNSFRSFLDLVVETVPGYGRASGVASMSDILASADSRKLAKEMIDYVDEFGLTYTRAEVARFKKWKTKQRFKDMTNDQVEIYHASNELGLIDNDIYHLPLGTFKVVDSEGNPVNTNEIMGSSGELKMILDTTLQNDPRYRELKKHVEGMLELGIVKGVRGLSGIGTGEATRGALIQTNTLSELFRFQTLRKHGVFDKTTRRNVIDALFEKLGPGKENIKDGFSQMIFDYAKSGREFDFYKFLTFAQSKGIISLDKQTGQWSIKNAELILDETIRKEFGENLFNVNVDSEDLVRSVEHTIENTRGEGYTQLDAEYIQRFKPKSRSKIQDFNQYFLVEEGESFPGLIEGKELHRRVVLEKEIKTPKGLRDFLLARARSSGSKTHEDLIVEQLTEKDFASWFSQLTSQRRVNEWSIEQYPTVDPEARKLNISDLKRGDVVLTSDTTPIVFEEMGTDMAIIRDKVAKTGKKGDWVGKIEIELFDQRNETQDIVDYMTSFVNKSKSKGKTVVPILIGKRLIGAEMPQISNAEGSKYVRLYDHLARSRDALKAVYGRIQAEGKETGGIKWGETEFLKYKATLLERMIESMPDPYSKDFSVGTNPEFGTLLGKNISAKELYEVMQVASYTKVYGEKIWDEIYQHRREYMRTRDQKHIEALNDILNKRASIAFNSNAESVHQETFRVVSKEINRQLSEGTTELRGAKLDSENMRVLVVDDRGEWDGNIVTSDVLMEAQKQTGGYEDVFGIKGFVRTIDAGIGGTGNTGLTLMTKGQATMDGYWDSVMRRAGVDKIIPLSAIKYADPTIKNSAIDIDALYDMRSGKGPDVVSSAQKINVRHSDYHMLHVDPKNTPRYGERISPYAMTFGKTRKQVTRQNNIVFGSESNSVSDFHGATSFFKKVMGKARKAETEVGMGSVAAAKDMNALMRAVLANSVNTENTPEPDWDSSYIDFIYSSPAANPMRPEVRLYTERILNSRILGDKILRVPVRSAVRGKVTPPHLDRFEEMRLTPIRSEDGHYGMSIGPAAARDKVISPNSTEIAFVDKSGKMVSGIEDPISWYVKEYWGDFKFHDHFKVAVKEFAGDMTKENVTATIKDLMVRKANLFSSSPSTEGRFYDVIDLAFAGTDNNYNIRSSFDYSNGQNYRGAARNIGILKSGLRYPNREIAHLQIALHSYKEGNKLTFDRETYQAGWGMGGDWDGDPAVSSGHLPGEALRDIARTSAIYSKAGTAERDIYKKYPSTYDPTSLEGQVEYQRSQHEMQRKIGIITNEHRKLEHAIRSKSSIRAVDENGNTIIIRPKYESVEDAMAMPAQDNPFSILDGYKASLVGGKGRLLADEYMSNEWIERLKREFYTKDVIAKDGTKLEVGADLMASDMQLYDLAMDPYMNMLKAVKGAGKYKDMNKTMAEGSKYLARTRDNVGKPGNMNMYLLYRNRYKPEVLDRLLTSMGVSRKKIDAVKKDVKGRAWNQIINEVTQKESIVSRDQEYIGTYEKYAEYLDSFRKSRTSGSRLALEDAESTEFMRVTLDAASRVAGGFGSEDLAQIEETLRKGIEKKHVSGATLRNMRSDIIGELTQIKDDPALAERRRTLQSQLRIVQGVLDNKSEFSEKGWRAPAGKKTATTNMPEHEVVNRAVRHIAANQVFAGLAGDAPQHIQQIRSEADHVIRQVKRAWSEMAKYGKVKINDNWYAVTDETINNLERVYTEDFIAEWDKAGLGEVAALALYTPPADAATGYAYIKGDSRNKGFNVTIRPEMRSSAFRYLSPETKQLLVMNEVLVRDSFSNKRLTETVLRMFRKNIPVTEQSRRLARPQTLKEGMDATLNVAQGATSMSHSKGLRPTLIRINDFLNIPVSDPQLQEILTIAGENGLTSTIKMTLYNSVKGRGVLDLRRAAKGTPFHKIKSILFERYSGEKSGFSHRNIEHAGNFLNVERLQGATGMFDMMANRIDPGMPPKKRGDFKSEVGRMESEFNRVRKTLTKLDPQLVEFLGDQWDPAQFIFRVTGKDIHSDNITEAAMNEYITMNDIRNVRKAIYHLGKIVKNAQDTGKWEGIRAKVKAGLLNPSAIFAAHPSTYEMLNYEHHDAKIEEAQAQTDNFIVDMSSKMNTLMKSMSVGGGFFGRKNIKAHASLSANKVELASRINILEAKGASSATINKLKRQYQKTLKKLDKLGRTITKSGAENYETINRDLFDLIESVEGVKLDGSVKFVEGKKEIGRELLERFGGNKQLVLDIAKTARARSNANYQIGREGLVHFKEILGRHFSKTKIGGFVDEVIERFDLHYRKGYLTHFRVQTINELTEYIESGFATGDVSLDRLKQKVNELVPQVSGEIKPRKSSDVSSKDILFVLTKNAENMARFRYNNAIRNITQKSIKNIRDLMTDPKVSKEKYGAQLEFTLRELESWKARNLDSQANTMIDTASRITRGLMTLSKLGFNLSPAIRNFSQKVTAISMVGFKHWQETRNAMRGTSDANRKFQAWVSDVVAGGGLGAHTKEMFELPEYRQDTSARMQGILGRLINKGLVFMRRGVFTGDPKYPSFAKIGEVAVRTEAEMLEYYRTFKEFNQNTYLRDKFFKKDFSSEYLDANPDLKRIQSQVTKDMSHQQKSELYWTWAKKVASNRATLFARDVHFGYSKGSRSKALAHPVGGTIGQFKHFTSKLIELYSKLGKEAMASKAVSSEWKEFAKTPEAQTFYRLGGFYLMTSLMTAVIGAGVGSKWRPDVVGMAQNLYSGTKGVITGDEDEIDKAFYGKGLLQFLAGPAMGQGTELLNLALADQIGDPSTLTKYLVGLRDLRQVKGAGKIADITRAAVPNKIVNFIQYDMMDVMEERSFGRTAEAAGNFVGIGNDYNEFSVTDDLWAGALRGIKAGKKKFLD